MFSDARSGKKLNRRSGKKRYRKCQSGVVFPGRSQKVAQKEELNTVKQKLIRSSFKRIFQITSSSSKELSSVLTFLGKAVMKLFRVNSRGKS